MPGGSSDVRSGPPGRRRLPARHREGADVQEKCLAIALSAKARLQVEHAEVSLLSGSGDIFIAGDSVSSQLRVSRKNSYCRLNLSGRPVVIKDSLNNLMLEDNPYREMVRSYLGVPVIVQNEVVGVVCVYEDEPRNWKGPRPESE